MIDDSHEYRVRPNVDAIPCPFLAAAYNHGDLVPNEDGTVPAEAVEEVLAKVGFDESLRTKLARGAAKAGTAPDALNLFKIHGSSIDHSGNTGIRDPKVDPGRLSRLLAFGENGRMYREHFARAANHFRDLDSGAKGTATETIELAMVLEVFGRDDGDGRRYLTDEDIAGLWLEGRYPEAWKPRPRDSITSRGLLMSTAKMGEKRVWGRLTQELLPKVLRGAGVLLVLGAVGLTALHIVIRSKLAPVVLPEYVALDTVRWLDQGWTPDDWQWYYHASQGGSMELPIPYSWIMNLERGEVPLLVFTKVGRLMDPEYMSRFGFLADPVRSYDVNGLSAGWAAPAGLSRLVEDQLNNPDSLPVGFVRTSAYPDRRYRAPDGSTGRVIDEVIGFNCSACHTGQLHYQGTGIRIEGGAAMIELGMFRNAVGNALGLTLLPGRFKRFATAVLGEGYTAAEAEMLKHQMGDLIRRGQALQAVETERGIYPTEEGFSRLDAVGRIGNYVLGEEISLDNLAVSDAPVNFPHIWDTPWFDWVQYNASFKLPIVRNAGEAMGVFAAVNFDDLEEPDSLFQSTMALGNLFEMEALIRGSEPYGGLRAPAWPEEILGEIDRELAVTGERLYVENCQGCHLPPFTDPAAFFSDSLWKVDADTSSLAREEHRYLETHKLELYDIGTDPEAALNMMQRTARLGPLGESLLGGSVSGDADVPFVTALGAAILNVVEAKFDSLGLSPEVRLTVSGDRSDPPAQALPQYKARPLNGVWATPPFLHNGSVQNIYQLLGPEEERDSTFWLGTKEYDPVRLGYVTGRVRGGFLLDTGLPGNSNKGHHFTGGPDSWREGRKGVIGRALSHEERMAIIEFLKAMPPVPGGM